MIGDAEFLFVRLFFAHIIADYLLQPDSWVAGKREKGWASPYLYYHGIFAGVLAYAFSGLWGSFIIPLVVVVTHIVIDGLTSPRSGPASIYLSPTN